MNTLPSIIRRTTIALTLLITIASCSKIESPPTEMGAKVMGDTVQLTPQQSANAHMSFAKAVRRELTTALRANGMVHVPPQFAYSVTAPFGGIVRTTSVLPGSHVTKGETIVVLESPEFITLQQDYLTTVANLEASEAELVRQSRLAKDSVNARKKLEAASADTRSLRVQRKALAEKLALINIDVKKLDENSLSRAIRVPSPISGYVTKVNINAGTYIAPNNPIMEIVNTDHMHIELTIFERDVLKLRIDQHVTVALTDAPNVKRDAHIHLIGKDVAADRTISVHAHLNKPDPTLIPGTTLTAIVDAEPRTSWVVPETAVVSFEGKYFVFTGSPTSCIRREVNVGITQDGITEILNDPPWLQTEDILVKGAPAVLGAMTNNDE